MKTKYERGEKMKKVLIYGTMAVVCVTGMFALTGCSKDDQTSPKVDNEGTSVVQETAKEIVLSDKIDVWPNGVYDYYGLPAYTAGTVVYAQPNSEIGNVFINTTMDEFDAYVKTIESKGFRYGESSRGDNSITGKILDKNTGKGYYITVEYVEGNTYNVNGEEKPYTLRMCVEKMEYEPEDIQADLMKEFGLTNDDILPKFAKVNRAYTEEMGADTSVRFKFDFDVIITEGFYKEYNKQMLEACKKVSDDKKVYDNSGAEINVDDVNEVVMKWTYTVAGKTYKIYFCEMPTIGGSLHMLIETK